jgi:hypothetical protein
MSSKKMENSSKPKQIPSEVEERKRIEKELKKKNENEEKEKKTIERKRKRKLELNIRKAYYKFVNNVDSLWLFIFSWVPLDVSLSPIIGTSKYITSCVLKYYEISQNRVLEIKGGWFKFFIHN